MSKAIDELALELGLEAGRLTMVQWPFSLARALAFCVMGNSSLFSSCNVCSSVTSQMVLTRRQQELTGLDFQASIARLQYSRHVTGVRMCFGRSRARAYGV